MRSTAYAVRIRGRVSFVDRLFQRSRVVVVRVVEDGREVDALQASSPESLRASLRLIYRHLRDFGATVEFTGVEERSLPMQLMAATGEAGLPNLEQAIEFLS